MRRTLHLLAGGAAALALPVIERELRDPDTRVTVVLLAGAAPAALPEGIPVRRVGQDLTHSELLDLIFENDRVIAW